MLEYSKMTQVEWDDHVAAINAKARSNGGKLDLSKAVIFNGSVAVMDDSVSAKAAMKSMSARDAYIKSLEGGNDFKSVLTSDYDRNHKASLSGMAGNGTYIPNNPNTSPEN